MGILGMEPSSHILKCLVFVVILSQISFGVHCVWCHAFCIIGNSNSLLKFSLQFPLAVQITAFPQRGNLVENFPKIGIWLIGFRFEFPKSPVPVILKQVE
jgi:hypothetical protein